MSINSSKVYCKFRNFTSSAVKLFVLIVAKCIVNLTIFPLHSTFSKCINSSKVYCKYDLGRSLDKGRKVLIVAKCIVNEVEGVNGASYIGVLIVAKCIVNIFIYPVF